MRAGVAGDELWEGEVGFCREALLCASVSDDPGGNGVLIRGASNDS